jgi:hypothetical protein
MKPLVLVAVAVAVAVAAAPAIADPAPVCNGQPCTPGRWYTSPISVTWDLNGGSNAGGCAPQNYVTDIDQSYLQSEPLADWPAWTYCNDPVSGTLKYYFIKVELSSPAATVAPSRPPDSAAWYNHPLAATVTATAFSGIASCTSTTYAGPNSTAATLSATCVDNAGKTVNVVSAPFAFDVTPPSLTAAADPGDGSVQLSWQAGGDLAPTASITVTRSPGDGTVYSGNSTGYTDTSARNGTRYTYTITARDVAGNASTQTVVATPAPRLLQPVANANVQMSAPPVLTWTPVRGATYYNVQLYRHGAKVLSMWPVHAKLQLPRKWRFEGHRYRLKPGRYGWFVWPGFGKRSAGRYGHRIGARTFVVR